MNLGQAAALEESDAIGDEVSEDGASSGVLERNVVWARALERTHLRGRLRGVIVPGLEELVDPAADPADLIAAADRQARRLRMQLETPLPMPTGPAQSLEAAVSIRAAREEEREWVRGHLHDTALQILEFIAGDGFGTGLTAKQIARLAGGAARDLRRWIDAEVEPPRTQLVAELESVAGEARALSSNVELEVVCADHAPTGERATALAGAVREALTNARKHANASRIVVRVDSEDGRTAVTVTDDGVGFDPDRVRHSRGLGVRGSIVGRMQRVGGHASLQQAPGGGTCVTLVTPTEDSA
jgi:anti-sigma regulatory factor (Ser/Thr protein kinase)